jgi:hypothetical protein
MSLQVKSGGVRRLVLTNKTASKSIDNHHVVRGPGMRNTSVRRAIQKRATNNSNGKPCGANNKICPDICFNYKRLTPLEWLYGVWVEALIDLGKPVQLGKVYNVDSNGIVRVCPGDIGCDVGTGTIVSDKPIIPAKKNAQDLFGTLTGARWAGYEPLASLLGAIVTAEEVTSRRLNPECDSNHSEILSDSNGLLGDYFVWNFNPFEPQREAWVRIRPGDNKNIVQNFVDSVNWYP